MTVQVVAPGKLPSPWIVDDDGSAGLRCLYDCFYLTPVSQALTSALDEEDVNRPLIITVATLKERVIREDGSRAILHDSPPGEFLANGLRH